MIEPMHLYPEEKERMQDMEQQGFTVMTCNNWLCPFNNDGYCVSPQHGDECSMYGDEEFQKYLNDVYDESLSDGLRELTRQVMIEKWGKESRMKPQELTVNVNCDLTVTKETAETCLKLVELFVNSHEGLYVCGTRNDDGSVSFYFKKWLEEK